MTLSGRDALMLAAGAVAGIALFQLAVYIYGRVAGGPPNEG